MSDLDAKEAELRRINEELDREFMSSAKSKKRSSKPIPPPEEEVKHEEPVAIEEA